VEAVFTSNHLTDTDKTVQENTQTKYNSNQQTTQNTAKQNYPGSDTLTTLGHEMRLAYSTTLMPQSHMGCKCYKGILQS